MSLIQIHSKYGKITAQPMACVDIKESIPEHATTEEEVADENLKTLIEDTESNPLS